MTAPDSPLRLRPGQQELTPEQMAEARRFAAARIEAQLSTAPVDEWAAEMLLRRAYAAAGLRAPRRVHWLDGPLELVAVLADGVPSAFVPERFKARVPPGVWEDAALERDEIALLKHGAADSVDDRIRRVTQRAERKIDALLGKDRTKGVRAQVASRVTRQVEEAVRTNVGERVWHAVGETAGRPVPAQIRDELWGRAQFAIWHSIAAFDEAPRLAELRFYDTYLTHLAGDALAQLNELVAGYWLGASVALLVRRPQCLSVDVEGRLHGASSPCVEYRDGLALYAWHGVQVPARVILEPESLTRNDFPDERNVEVRRIIQERMGGRFFDEIGARYVDGGSRGVLYEVSLPGDLDTAARYVRVLDPSTGREYYLRVPPTMITAAQAVAWTFGLRPDEYAPDQES